LKRGAALFASAFIVATVVEAQGPALPDAFARPDKGNCLACHELAAPAGRPGGNVGPVLTGTRMRELGPARLRQLLDDPMRFNASTTMPPFGRHQILTGAEMDAITRVLPTLPDGEPLPPTVTADGSDAALPAVLERGRALWTRKFGDKRSLSGCFPNGGRRIAALYPQYDARVKRVVTLEMAINQCLKAHREALFDPLDPDTMGAVIAYVRSLSDGQKVAVKLPQAAQPRFEEGRRLYFTRMGQRNFACASCHNQAAGKRYGTQVLPPLAGLTTGASDIQNGKPLTLQARMRECLERMGAAPFAGGSDELNHLEYFITQQSNGLPLRTAAPRPR
jgi:L-cysteine S-thiosulfotransferase